MRTQLSKLSVVVGIILAAITLAIIYTQPAEAAVPVIKQRYNQELDMTFLAV